MGSFVARLFEGVFSYDGILIGLSIANLSCSFFIIRQFHNFQEQTRQILELYSEIRQDIREITQQNIRDTREMIQQNIRLMQQMREDFAKFKFDLLRLDFARPFNQKYAYNPLGKYAGQQEWGEMDDLNYHSDSETDADD